MKVLVACEYSGTVRDAFIRHGHDAISCDLLETESPGPHHKGDVRDILGNGFDLLIGHPPCTYLSYAAMRVWNNSGRIKLRLEALDFFRQLWEAPIDKICLENPKGCASPVIAKYSQEIQPFYWGDPVMKTTWLWLKNLPPLEHYEVDNLFHTHTHTHAHTIKNKSSGRVEYWTESLTGKNRQKERARFWPGIAEAMAEQWGTL